MQGRFHIYEGIAPDVLQIPLRALKLIGCEQVLLTNAAGSLHQKMGPGSLMLIEDHINFTGINPLIGINDDAAGPRFQDLTQAYDINMSESIQRVAKEMDIELHKGVSLWVIGPTFKTP
ncbi:hypothetical protein [Marinomonas sp. 2405UD68-3]|uniref:phosphorylase family protein n=1 Tax=Marinomonas sp. 2405UD68-3 TaxID=3391835 RepID=UPI0039C8F1AC